MVNLITILDAFDRRFIVKFVLKFGVVKHGRSKSSCSSRGGRCFMGRTEIARYQPQTYKTLRP